MLQALSVWQWPLLRLPSSSEKLWSTVSPGWYIEASSLDSTVVSQHEGKSGPCRWKVTVTQHDTIFLEVATCSGCLLVYYIYQRQGIAFVRGRGTDL